MTRKNGSLAFLILLAACSKAPDPSAALQPKAAAVSPMPAVAAQADGGIDWQKSGKKEDVDAAFAAARAANKPLFLYWGAVWCPPCNQVKATIFNRQDFIDRSRFFVPVYLDGDSPSAQQLGARFKVSGYPTMILFKPDGTEITRLPGEVDSDQYMRVLAMGMNGARPVKETLAAALAGTGNARSGLSPEDWRMLAYYSWDTDETELIPKKELAATLQRLAQNCPAEQAPQTAHSATRLELKALAAAAPEAGAGKSPSPQVAADAANRALQVLRDPTLARENFDLITSYPAEITGYVTAPSSAARVQMVEAWNAALDRLAADATLSTADRLAAVMGKVALARMDRPKGEQRPLPEALLQQVRDEAARADRETSDAYARQSVISAAAETLTEAGLLDASDALLKSELQRSHSPYYFMLGLAGNAKKRGDKAAALDWYAQAYAAAEGPATRLQWGAAYVNALVELSPRDEARIGRAAQGIIGELDAVPETFYGRNQRSLERMGKKLAGWSSGGGHASTFRQVGREMSQVCAKLPAADPSRASCEAVLRPPKTTAKA